MRAYFKLVRHVLYSRCASKGSGRHVYMAVSCSAGFFASLHNAITQGLTTLPALVTRSG